MKTEVDCYPEKKNNRSIPIELIDETNTITYDVQRYIELLAQTCIGMWTHVFSERMSMEQQLF